MTKQQKRVLKREINPELVSRVGVWKPCLPQVLTASKAQRGHCPWRIVLHQAASQKGICSQLSVGSGGGKRPAQSWCGIFQRQGGDLAASLSGRGMMGVSQLGKGSICGLRQEEKAGTKGNFGKVRGWAMRTVLMTKSVTARGRRMA